MNQKKSFPPLQARIGYMSSMIDNIIELTEGMDLASFKNDKFSQLAVERCFEVLGEAAKCIPDDFREQNQVFPWKGVTGIRDVIAHEYYKTDPAVIWRTAVIEVPKIKKIMPGLENLAAAQSAKDSVMSPLKGIMDHAI